MTVPREQPATMGQKGGEEEAQGERRAREQKEMPSGAATVQVCVSILESQPTSPPFSSAVVNVVASSHNRACTTPVCSALREARQEPVPTSQIRGQKSPAPAEATKGLGPEPERGGLKRAVLTVPVWPRIGGRRALDGA